MPVFSDCHRVNLIRHSHSLGKLTDVSFYQGGSWLVFALPAALIAVTLVFAISTVLSAYIMSQISQSVLVTLRKNFFYSIALAGIAIPESIYWSHRSKSLWMNLPSPFPVRRIQLLFPRSAIPSRSLVCCVSCSGTTGFWLLVTFVIGPALFIVLVCYPEKSKVVVKQSQETLEIWSQNPGIIWSGTNSQNQRLIWFWRWTVLKKVNMRIRRLALKTNILQGLPYASDADSDNGRGCIRRGSSADWSSRRCADIRSVRNLPVRPSTDQSSCSTSRRT